MPQNRLEYVLTSLKGNLLQNAMSINGTRISFIILLGFFNNILRIVQFDVIKFLLIFPMISDVDVNVIRDLLYGLSFFPIAIIKIVKTTWLRSGMRYITYKKI